MNFGACDFSRLVVTDWRLRRWRLCFLALYDSYPNFTFFVFVSFPNDESDVFWGSLSRRSYLSRLQAREGGRRLTFILYFSNIYLFGALRDPFFLIILPPKSTSTWFSRTQRRKANAAASRPDRAAPFARPAHKAALHPLSQAPPPVTGHSRENLFSCCVKFKQAASKITMGNVSLLWFPGAYHSL